MITVLFPMDNKLDTKAADSVQLHAIISLFHWTHALFKEYQCMQTPVQTESKE